MTFSDRPPSKEWTALKYRGEPFAEVWFKPEGEPFALTIRIPQNSFQIPGMVERLTMENLLKAVGIEPEEVEFWRQGDVTHAGMSGSNPELGAALGPPPQDVAQLDLYVRLKPPPQAADRGERDIPLEKWQELEARWKAILVLETALDSLRNSMDALLAQMETGFNKPLRTEDKLHAPRADISQWTRAKSRVHNALPKMKDFIHRAVWAIGSPERKRLEEIYRDHIQPHIPFPDITQVLKQLEDLRKDRQVLSAQGQTVYQEAKTILAELQATLRTLQSNAIANARRKKG